MISLFRVFRYRQRNHRLYLFSDESENFFHNGGFAPFILHDWDAFQAKFVVISLFGYFGIGNEITGKTGISISLSTVLTTGVPSYHTTSLERVWNEIGGDFVISIFRYQ